MTVLRGVSATLRRKDSKVLLGIMDREEAEEAQEEEPPSGAVIHTLYRESWKILGIARLVDRVDVVTLSQKLGMTVTKIKNHCLYMTERNLLTGGPWWYSITGKGGETWRDHTETVRIR